MNRIRNVLKAIGALFVLIIAAIAFGVAYGLWKHRQDRTSPGVDIETVVEAE